MKTSFNLSQLQWQLSGFIPEHWRFSKFRDPEIPAVPARVPGSVQLALLEAGILPDWNVGLQSRQCEWGENRHWIYQTTIDSAMLPEGQAVRFRCMGLDSSGEVWLNDQQIGSFDNGFMPYVFDLTGLMQPGANDLRIIFTCPPRWLGQFHFTSKLTQWKARFNYTWDWVSRLVQIGIWDEIVLESVSGGEFGPVDCSCQWNVEEQRGVLYVSAPVNGAATGMKVQTSLSDGQRVIRQNELDAEEFGSAGVTWKDLPVEAWWPNGLGSSKLYRLSCRLVDAGGLVHDELALPVGFKHISWQQCQDVPPHADPWICVVNGKPLFLQGVNWTPIRPNFADVTEEDYRLRIQEYRRLGCNLFRVWGGAFLEKECFYRLCDEMGIMVWQEFPLSSSGPDNCPPFNEPNIQTLVEIAESYIQRRKHHVSLLLWCGGNELMGPEPGGQVPITTSHPLIARLADTVERLDPLRRFLPTSASGPSEWGAAENFGKGLHWDVHGPWKPEGTLEQWRDYWSKDDALFRSETGAPGASSVEIIRRFKGELPDFPANHANPLWLRTCWWIEWDQFTNEHGRLAVSLEEYVTWSQQRQAKALAIAVDRCKSRFPRCGGVLIWMGHDCFPCTANTAIVDFDGKAKPAGEAIGEIFRRTAAKS